MSKNVLGDGYMLLGKRQSDPKREELLRLINAAAREMTDARQRFNNADEDMLEACIFEMNAAKARYGSLMKEYKALEAAQVNVQGHCLPQQKSHCQGTMG